MQFSSVMGRKRRNTTENVAVRVNNKTGYYFQVIIYPEFSNYIALYQMGAFYESPIHNAHARERPPDNMILIGNQGKPHKHIMIRAYRKMTAIAFVRELLQHLNNDITGIRIDLEQILVNDVTQTLRYYTHRDCPIKEQFDLYDVFEKVPLSFITEITKAYDIEIRMLVVNELLAMDIKSLNSYISLKNGIGNIVLQNWLCKGHNLYFVKTIIDENIKHYGF